MRNISEYPQGVNMDFNCHPVVSDIAEHLTVMNSRGYDVIICWVPGHVGIVGS